MVGHTAFGQKRRVWMLYEICFAKEAKEWFQGCRGKLLDCSRPEVS